MAAHKLKLGMPEVAKIIDERHARESDGWRKTRLLAVKLASRGEMTSGKDPQAELAFKEQPCEKLVSLGLETGSKVKVWVMDEARFGLRTELRRVGTLRGKRPVVPRQIKYQWDYLYGALSVMGGEAHFAHLPGVNLEWDEIDPAKVLGQQFRCSQLDWSPVDAGSTKRFEQNSTVILI